MKTIRYQLLAIMLAAIGFTASADVDFSIGDITYSLMDNGTVTVKGLSPTGAAKSSIPQLTIPSRVQYNGTYYRVSGIGYQAFMGKTNILSVEIRWGAYNMMNDAFRNCTNLTSVKLPSSLQGGIYHNVFQGCSKLKSVYYAALEGKALSYTNDFPSNSGMTLYIPYGCKTSPSDYKALSGWTNFANVQYSHDAFDLAYSNGGNTYYVAISTWDSNPYSQYGSVTREFTVIGCGSTTTSFNPGNYISVEGISAHITAIANYAANGNTSITSVDLGNASYLKSVGQYAFYGCTSLASATVLAEEIGYGAFMKCTNLTSFTLKEGVKRLGNSIVSGTPLTQLRIPASLTSFNYAADGAKSLISIAVESGNTNYKGYSGTLFSADYSRLVRQPEGRDYVSFPPDNLTLSIEPYAFQDCYKLQETIELPYGMTNIKNYAFLRVDGLKKLVIPSSVTSIGSKMLQSCASLTDLYINRTTPPSATMSDMFGSNYATIVPSITLHLPYASDITTKYKDAGWTGFKTYNSGNDPAYDFKEALANYGSAQYTVTSTTAQNLKGRDGVWYGFDGLVKMVASPNANASGSVVIPDLTQYRGKRYAVTQLGFYSLFSSGTSDYHVSGGWHVNNIEYAAGALATHLTGVDLPNANIIGSMAFFGATNLASFTISPELYSIGGYAFASTKLSGNMILPYGIVTVGEQAFYGTKLTRLLIPSSVTNLGGNVAGGSTSLNELVINIDANKTASDGIVLSNIGTAKIRVPVGQVGQYKQHNVYKNLASQIEAGGYDFIYGENYDSSPGYMYHMTVIWPWSEGDTYTNSEGTEYENVWGWAQYVYHPNIKGGTTFYTDEVETDKRTGKRYIMVALGDSVFAGANNLEVVDGTLATILSIGHHAFESTAVKHRLTFPNALSVGELAFSNMTKCPEVDLLTPIDLSNYFKDSYIFDRNRDDFKMYVDNTYFKKAYDYCMDWDMGDGHYANQLRPFIHATGEVMPVSCFLEWVNYTSLGLEAYSVTGYDESAKTLKLTKHDDHTLNYQENGVILTGLEKDQIYKLEPWAGGEGLVSTADWDNYLTENWEAWTLKSDDPLKRWGWNATDKKFVRPASSMSIPGGSALLYIGDSAPALNIDEWTLEGVGNKYDVNGDGNVDVGDVNAILEAILNHNNSSKYDVNNDNNVDVGDVNAVLGYILEHS